jgi:hypothetical protein
LKAATLAFIAVVAVSVSAQSVTVNVAGDALQIKAPGFGIVQGSTLDRLKDGRSVQLDLEFAILTGPSGRQLVQTRQSFNLSFDIWEERFVVTRTGTPPKSISLARPADTDAWCLANITVPLSAFGGRDRSAPFWVRLGYRIQDPGAAAAVEAEPGFTLMGLIDKLSKKSQDAETARSMEAGPFRLTN